MEYLGLVQLFQAVIVLTAFASFLAFAGRRTTKEPSGNIALALALLVFGLSFALAIVHLWLLGTASLTHAGMAFLGPALVLALVFLHLRAALSRIKGS
jgi:dipeptide/tripeptide permease